ncbi:VIN3-like protein 3 [Linum grandiflorum]
MMICVLGCCVVDPEQRSQLSFEEKRDLACKIAGCASNDVFETLSSFTRTELRQIICAEMGKERKYTGYDKSRMINQLLKVVSSKNNAPTGKRVKRKRLNECERREQEEEEEEMPDCKEVNEKQKVQLVCPNAACRSALSSDDAFCKRCSCCICHYYDENKDPSLWLTCASSSSSDDENLCGLTCHLICAMKDSRSGIIKTGSCTKLEGCFYCVACGKVNELMRIWRKQLMIAMEARRVDVLCLRLLLGQKILSGIEQYSDIHEMLETGVQMLQNELGPFDLVCTKMARGIVNRLSCGAQVQKLCASALEAFDSKSKSSADCSNQQKKESNGSTDKKRKYKDVNSCVIALTNHHRGSFSPSTPCKSNETQPEKEDVSGAAGWKRREKESSYEYSVRVIKWLEEQGEIEETFRVKLLTWFSLKASDQERRVVNAFVDTLVDHPPTLAQQLKHSFLDEITCDPRNAVTAQCGICSCASRFRH